MKPRLYSTKDVEQLATFFNRACQGKRHFVPLNGKTVAEILARGSKKDFGKLVVMGESESFSGACHTFFDAKERIGYMAYLLALPGLESKIWPLLLQATYAAFPRASKFVIGSPYTPLYHAVEGRGQPFWGAAETMEVNGADSLLRNFLYNNSFIDRHNYVTLRKSWHDSIIVNGEGPRPLDVGGVFELLRGDDCWYNAYDWYKKTSAEEFGLRNKSLSVLVHRKGHKVIGHTAWYPLRQRGSAAFCDLEVAREARGQGLGKILLARTLQQMKLDKYTSCELFTSESQNVRAFALYLSHGFKAEATWYEMST